MGIHVRRQSHTHRQETVFQSHTDMERIFLLCLLGLAGSQHGFFRGYSNKRTWGLGPQRQSQGPVCGTDGKTYSSTCQLKKTACKMVRRQGRSFQSKMLKIEVAHPGSCSEPCAEMSGMGQFQAFDSMATNNGLCIHDFFQCAKKMRRNGMGARKVQQCCQARFDKCSRVTV